MAMACILKFNFSENSEKQRDKIREGVFWSLPAEK